MSTDLIFNIAAVLVNGLFMFVAVYRPDTFGGGAMAKIVFTLNFIAVIFNWTAFLLEGGLA